MLTQTLIGLGLLLIGHWTGRAWAAHEVRAAEDKADEFLSDRNHWHRAAKDAVALSAELARVTVPDDARARLAKDFGALDGDPPSVRQADRTEVERRRNEKQTSGVTRKRSGDEVPIAINDKEMPPSTAAVHTGAED